MNTLTRIISSYLQKLDHNHVSYSSHPSLNILDVSKWLLLSKLHYNLAEHCLIGLITHTHTHTQQTRHLYHILKMTINGLLFRKTSHKHGFYIDSNPDFEVYGTPLYLLHIWRQYQIQLNNIKILSFILIVVLIIIIITLLLFFYVVFLNIQTYNM